VALGFECLFQLRCGRARENQLRAGSLEPVTLRLHFVAQASDRPMKLGDFDLGLSPRPLRGALDFGRRRRNELLNEIGHTIAGGGGRFGQSTGRWRKKHDTSLIGLTALPL
jgi:hypothetical protein